MWVQDLPGGAQVTALTYSPDGRTLYTGDMEGRVIAWDVAARTGTELYRRAEPPTGNRGVHHFWPTRDGRLLFTDDRTLMDALPPGAGPVLQARFGSWGWWKLPLPDGRRMTSVEPEWKVGLWDLATGARLIVPGALGDARGITFHALLADGNTFLTYGAGDELALWDFATGEKVGALTPSKGGIKPAALSADTNTLAVGRTMELWVYDVPSRSLRHRLKAARAFRVLAFHPDGRRAASAATDSAVTLWDVAAGAEAARYDWGIRKPACLAFAPDGLTCAVGGSKRFAVFDVDG